MEYGEGIYFDMKINISKIKDELIEACLYFPEDSGEIILELHYESIINIGHILFTYATTLEDSSELPKFFQPTLLKKNTSSNFKGLFNINFDDAKITYHSSSWGTGKGKTIFKLSEVSLFYDLLPNFKSEANATFWLSNTADIAIEEFYSHSFSYKGNWVSRSRFQKYLSYGEVKYKFLFKYERTGSEKYPWSNTITRKPYLHLKYDAKKVLPEKALEYGRFICSLIALYFHQNVGFEQIRIITPKYKVYIPFERKIYLSTGYAYLFHYGFEGNFERFLHALEFDKILVKDLPLLCNWIERFNNSLLMDNESKFILLYKLLERVKTELKVQAPKENFQLDISHVGAKEMLREDIFNSKVINHLDESQRDFFVKKVVDQAFFYPQKDAFIKLFERLELKPEDFEVNMDKIHKARSKVVHGSTEANTLIDSPLFVPNFQKLVGATILKVLGLTIQPLNE